VTFEIFQDRAGKWRWRLRHENGNIIADSGEGYSTKSKAKEGIEVVRNYSDDAEITVEGD